MAWQKIPKEHKPLFLDVLPKDDRIEVIHMFGGIAATINRNMAAGLWANSFMVRVDAKAYARALKKGAEPFNPMGRNPMKDMVLLPEGTLAKKAEARRWLQLAIDFTSTLPPKEKKAKKAGKGTAKKAATKKAAKKKTAKKAANKSTAKKATAKKTATKAAVKPKTAAPKKKRAPAKVASATKTSTKKPTASRAKTSTAGGKKSPKKGASATPTASSGKRKASVGKKAAIGKKAAAKKSTTSKKRAGSAATKAKKISRASKSRTRTS